MVPSGFLVQLWEQNQNKDERPLINENQREQRDYLNTYELNPGTRDAAWHQLLTHHVVNHSLPCSQMLHLWIPSNSEVCCVIFLCVVIIYHRNKQLANHILLNYTAEINTLIATLAPKVALEKTKPHVCLWRLWSLATIISLVNTFYSSSTAGWTNCTSQVLNYDFQCLRPLGILWEFDQWNERQNKSLRVNKFMRGNWKGSYLQCSEAGALLGRLFSFP